MFLSSCSCLRQTLIRFSTGGPSTRIGDCLLCGSAKNLEVAERLFLSQTVHVDSAEALQLADSHGCSSYDAEFVVLAQQLACPLLTFDHKLLQLFPQVAVKPGS
jgi:hypothetical protein